MHPGDILRRVWHRFEQFAYAMDYDPQTELERRVAKLERVLHGRGAPLPETVTAEHANSVD